MGKVLACGVPRTGSTLVWQVLLRALPGRVVAKAHPASWAPEDGWFIVGSVRHPYDTAASCFRGRVVGDDGDGSPQTVKGTRAGLIAELKMMDNNFKALKVLIERYPKSHAVLRYEDFFNDFDVIFDMIHQTLGVGTPPKRRRRIKAECSFEANLERSYKPREDYQRNKINYGHVGVGTPGSWKLFMPRWGYAPMKKWCDPWCKELGYES